MENVNIHQDNAPSHWAVEKQTFMTVQLVEAEARIKTYAFSELWKTSDSFDKLLIGTYLSSEYIGTSVVCALLEGTLRKHDVDVE